MKMVIAHVRREELEPIRTELDNMTLRSLSISEMTCPDPEHATTLQYRGTRHRYHLRRTFKLECVVADEDVAAVAKAVLKHTRSRPSEDDAVFVVPMQTAFGTAADEPDPQTPRAERVPVGALPVRPAGVR